MLICVDNFVCVLFLMLQIQQIPLKGNDKHQGLGCASVGGDGDVGSGSGSSSLKDPKQKHKAKIWEKTQQRYHASESTVDIFKNCSDESD